VGNVRVLRVVGPVLMALIVVLALAPAAAADTATATVDIRGLEYAATATQGRFGGAATGQVDGGWLATVVHDPLRRGEAVPITGGSFTLHSTQSHVSGTFVRGAVRPLGTSGACGNERFDVTGTLALHGGGRGSFSVVLTHLRAQHDGECRTYGAVVAGSLRVPSATATA
jgi:hypothetical protein